jgi:hypothetical protein
MKRAVAAEKVGALVDRASTTETQVVGVLTLESDGALAVTVDADVEIDVLELGIRARARRTASVVTRELEAVTPVAESEVTR